MKQHINIGPVPCEEDCEQLGPTYRPDVARAECRRFLALIQKRLGPGPEGARLRIKGFDHDFGRYYEVVCEFDDDDTAAFNYALRCENDAPTHWEEEKTDATA